MRTLTAEEEHPVSGRQLPAALSARRSAIGGRRLRRAQACGRSGCKAFGAGDDFLGRGCGGLNVFVEIAAQRDVSCDQTARRLNDEPLRFPGSPHNAHRYRAGLGYHPFKLRYVRDCCLPFTFSPRLAPGSGTLGQGWASFQIAVWRLLVSTADDDDRGASNECVLL